MGQPTRDKVPLLVHLDKITNICIGVLDDNDVGKMSLPELLSVLEVSSRKEVIAEANYMMDKLLNEIKLLEQDFYRARSIVWGNARKVKYM